MNYIKSLPAEPVYKAPVFVYTSQCICPFQGKGTKISLQKENVSVNR